MNGTSIATKMLNLAMIALASSRSVSAEKEYHDCHCHDDPHFKTFGGKRYDFHGGCPLVLVQSDFMDIHIETEVKTGYSSIQSVGFRMNMEMDDPVFIDKNTDVTEFPKMLGRYEFNYVAATQRYELILDDGQYVTVSAWNGKPSSVMVHGLKDSFGDAKGMCGEWDADENDLLDRNGDDMDNGNDMGAEWKVRTADRPIPGVDSKGFMKCAPEVFHGGGEEGRKRCAINKCMCIPKADFECGENCKEKQCVEEDEITTACKDVTIDGDRENCKFDVKTTGDVEFAKAPFYAEVIPPVVTTGKSGKAGKADKSDKIKKSDRRRKTA